MANIVLHFFCLIIFVEVNSEYSNTWLWTGDVNQSEAKQISHENGFIYVDKLITGHHLVMHPRVNRSSRTKSNVHLKVLRSDKRVISFGQESWKHVNQRQIGTSFTPKDPEWAQMWYINKRGIDSMRLLEAWQKNYTGKGINIGIIDDGVDYNNRDLIGRYDRANSRDVYDNDPDPMPATGEVHGTECAGVALASSGGQFCALGSSFQSNLVAVRLISSGVVTESGQVRALTNSAVHVSSNSWGGTEYQFDGPSQIVQDALRRGVRELRNGKGVVYVYAGGNGGFRDNCNLDGYVSSIYTIGINGVAFDYEPPGYAEPCSAILASAFSGKGGHSTNNLYTTSVNNACISSFSGTSAATPLAAGAIALLLQSRPGLHWRDVQELIIRTSRTNVLKYGYFKTNAVGRNVSDWFGYGLIDTMGLINAAKNWNSLPEQHTCVSSFRNDSREVKVNDKDRIIQSSITTDGCNNTVRYVNSVEHVQVRVIFSYSTRGMIVLSIESPMGTVSKLLTARNKDKDSNSQIDWTYMSVHHWGENPVGTWKLNFSVDTNINERGTLIGWELTLSGTGVCCVPNKTQTDGPSNNADKTVLAIGNVAVAVICGLCLACCFAVILYKKKKIQSMRVRTCVNG